MASEQEIIQLYNPPRECADDRCDNLFLEFIYCVVIPTAIVLLLLMLLAMVMFCNSKSCKCKTYSALSTQTNDLQMENYNSIRRASANLRLMSQNRETPLMGSRTSSMTLDRSQRRPHRPRDSGSSAPSTLQRHNRLRHQDQSASGPPPPYTVEQEESSAGFQGRSFPTNVDMSSPPPPPPPAYSPHSDDVFLGTEFLQSGMQTSVRYDDSPDHNGSGGQPLLFHRSYDG